MNKTNAKHSKRHAGKQTNSDDDGDNHNKKDIHSLVVRLWRHLDADQATSLRRQFERLRSKETAVLDSEFPSDCLVNTERVDSVLEFAKKFDVMAEFVGDAKSNETSEEMRRKGNEMFKMRRLKEACEFYTESVALAENGSEALALAYANRSAVLLEVDLYQECLEDIDRALDNPYPADLKPKLVARRQNANSKKANNQLGLEPYEVAPTLPNKNPQIQSAADSIAICHTESMGRHIVTTRNVKAGEVLAVEQPFATTVIDEAARNHCHECLKTCHNLIPCKNCTISMYCGQPCMSRALLAHHKYVCPIGKTLQVLQVDKLKALPLKIALVASDLGTSVEDHDEVYRSDRFAEIARLFTGVKRRSDSDLFERSTWAALLYGLVERRTGFFDEEENNCGKSAHRRKLFKEVLMRMLMAGPANFHEISEMGRNAAGVFESDEVGSGAYALLSMFNHACSPNVVRHCHGTTIVVRALEDIKEGEQCFDNYGYHHALTSKPERVSSLSRQYHFVCQCQACQEDWALFDDLPGATEDLNDDLLTQLQSCNVETASAALPDYMEKCAKLVKAKPCKNHCQMQEVVKQCFASLANKRFVF